MNCDLKINNMEKNELIENLKCCGNCSKYLDDFDNSKCEYPKSIYNNYCDKWQSDGMTRSQREMK